MTPDPTEIAALCERLRGASRLHADQHRSGTSALFAVAASALEALSAGGWKLVPVEPTEAMLKAGADDNAAIMHDYDAPGWLLTSRAIWSAMLAASPQQGGAA